MKAVSNKPPNCQQCHRPGQTLTLITLAPVAHNPATQWLCGKCASQAREELRTYLAHKPASKLTPPEWSKTRIRIFARDQGLCCYCGCTLTLATGTIDHLVPKSRGGSHADSNLVLSCSPCNNTKANEMPDEAGMQLLYRHETITWLPTPFWKLAQTAPYHLVKQDHLTYRALAAGAGC